MSLLFYIEDIIVAFIVLLIVCVIVRDGWTGLVRIFVHCILYLPAIKPILNWYLKKQVHGFLKQLGIKKDGVGGASKIMPIPVKGNS